MRFKKRLALLSLLCFACALSVVLTACFGKKQENQENDEKTPGFESQQTEQTGQTVTVGKVTSIIGNQIVLAVGKLSGSRNATSSSQNSSQTPGTTSSSGNSSASSDGIELTGETKTFLIPVGLSLSAGGFSNGGGTLPRGNVSAPAGQGFAAASGGGNRGGQFNRTGTSRQATGAFSGNRGTASGAGTAGPQVSLASGSSRRSEDFSSIKTGMILQITERTLSDGTKGITQVRILSR